MSLPLDVGNKPNSSPKNAEDFSLEEEYWSDENQDCMDALMIYLKAGISLEC
ncbi:hypothetical protein PPACK8108_LOCUS12823 [Phakopsora pachyrhizi]|uniref:Uncharacterized protein n=1 Tax=Phakopsora pachyrhizi TaxID=170000 RepID=A0AAV0B2F8_PHAPC|nr:hypothetical protein PPACK8108_LOCUS12823 [Phakopsora pachyrhizi]